MYNPYENALDGLLLDNPVSAFFQFCKDREEIRLKRESGVPAPWSDDEIFQKGRFLNVFREDDRGSKAIIDFSKNLNSDLTKLVQTIFFARWCNRQETLDQLKPELLSQPKKISKWLSHLKPWCNNTAYPVESIHWEGKHYSRLFSATHIFDKAKHKLTKIIIDSQGSVIKATNDINEIFKMNNDFPIFMAVMDIAWFRPDIINPHSHVPVGIGAIAYLKRLQTYLKLKNAIEVFDEMITLQKELWPEAKREFHPIDIEYISCECRKYYSYINGTKLFEGKNRFKPKK